MIVVTAPKHFPPVSFLRECFDYTPETGEFRWRARPADHFNDPRVFTRWCRHKVGTRAFSIRKNHPYPTSCVTYQGREIELMAHRVAWALVTGEYPKDQIDHINCDGHDCRFSNLREANQSLNNANRRRNKTQKGPLKGVAQHPKTGRWKSQIQVNGVSHYLGYFATAEDAHAAYVAAASRHYGEFARAA